MIIRSVSLLLLSLCAIACNGADVGPVRLAAVPTLGDGCKAASCISGRVVGIVDGDTVDLLVTVGGQHQQVRVRLTEIDTPERRQPWGNRAKQALAEKVFQQDVEVEVSGTDRYDRTLGRIWLGNRDINRELIAEGYAWAYRDYLTDISLLEDEKSAREERLGLWSMANPVPPWQWRRGSRSSPEVIAPEDTSGCGAKRTCGQMSR